MTPTVPTPSAARRPRPGTGLTLVAVLLAAASCDSPSATRPAVSMPTVGPGVAEAIVDRGEARVMVALRPIHGLQLDQGGSGTGADRDAVTDADIGPGGLISARRLPARERQVAALADGVLERVASTGRDGSGGGVELRRRFAAVPALALTVRDTAALARLAADEAVVRIDLDVGGRGSLAVSVPQIGADLRHARGNDGAGITVAILDTGVDTDHPSLAGRIVHQACFIASGGTCPGGGSEEVGAGAAEDESGHGTHVSGIMISDGTVGSPGVAPAAELAAVKVMYDCSFSGCFDSFSDVVAGLDHLITLHDSIPLAAVNMSLGTSTLFDGVCDQAASWTIAGSDAVNALLELGTLTMASAGNDGSDTSMTAPACLENVIAVAAVNSTDIMASFSNTNDLTNLAAPGVGIVSLGIGGGTTSASGTSMASPHVVGCAALLFQDEPHWTALEVRTRLLTSPIQVTDPSSGVVMPRLDCSPSPEPLDPRSTVTVTRP